MVLLFLGCAVFDASVDGFAVSYAVFDAAVDGIPVSYAVFYAAVDGIEVSYAVLILLLMVFLFLRYPVFDAAVGIAVSDAVFDTAVVVVAVSSVAVQCCPMLLLILYMAVKFIEQKRKHSRENFWPAFHFIVKIQVSREPVRRIKGQRSNIKSGIKL